MSNTDQPEPSSAESRRSTEAADRGVQFPRHTDGSRSTTRAGTAIMLEALRPFDLAHAQAAAREQHWRRNYPLHFRRLVEGGLRAPECVTRSAEAGLHAFYDVLRFVDDDGDRSLANYEAEPESSVGYRTLSLRGTGIDSPAPWSLPYRGQHLSGSALLDRLADWQQRGIIEPSAAAALTRCAQHPEWFDLSDQHLMLLGAGSEAGPLPWLARWRAQIYAVDVTRPEVWQRLVSTVRAGNATLHAPLSGTGRDWNDVGADLLLDPRGIADWALHFNHPLAVAAHAYLDGERHVRVAVAMDLIQRRVSRRRFDTSLAFMATPTDVFAVPGHTARQAMNAYRARGLLSRAMQPALRLASGDRLFQPNVQSFFQHDRVEYGVVDSLVLEQGPNYALAKRLQQWRALSARAAGQRVSLNVAPSTATSSVLKNAALKAGFAGADTFGIEVFEPATTNAIMAALWVHDVRCDQSAANPERTLAHPFELFMDGACHGGLWTCAYLPRSALPYAALVGWARGRFAR